MGLLSDLGEILSFQESQKLQKALRKTGIKQFLFVLQKYRKWVKSTSQCHIKWGEEIQGHFLQKDSQGSLHLCKSNLTEEYLQLEFPLMFEYGSWMFQMVPTLPYNTANEFSEIILSIRQKYQALNKKSRLALTIPVIPFLGVRQKDKEKEFINTITKSQFIDDSHISKHPRFSTLTKNIRMKRGCTVQIKVPILQDKYTNMKQISEDQPYPGFIYMDAMAFGMGMSCLQCTFSTKSLDHARYIYDQMHVLSPIFLALTAGTPFHKGKMADWDTRWKIIQASVDDRTVQQLDPKNQKYLPTSRYCPAQCYIWEGNFNRPQFNDVPLNLNKDTVQQIKKYSEDMGIPIDDPLANHIANIFKRDILVVYERFKHMSEEEYLIFEMLNGTNWNSVRLKIPIDEQIGWRVEFRSMEVMLTADQNSAFSLFIHFITRALHFASDLNFYIPISAVLQNFDRAHKKDAVRKEKFLFRTNVIGNQQPIIQEMYISQILFGKGQYIGLFNLVEERIKKCLKKSNCVSSVISNIKHLIEDIATGKRLTLAQWIRQYVNDHPLYKHDSILPKRLMDELLQRLSKISKGEIKDPNWAKIFDQ